MTPKNTSQEASFVLGKAAPCLYQTGPGEESQTPSPAANGELGYVSGGGRGGG